MTPLFGTALARSGGGLLSHVVSAHPEAMLARHPFLQIFKSFRNAIVRDLGIQEVSAVVAPAAPLDDYYFSAPKRRLLDAVLDADLDLPFEDGSEEFVAAAIARCEHESPDLAPHFSRLPAPTYRQVLDNALTLVGEARAATDRRWVGFQDPWILEFFPSLARAYPEARFVVLLRDPRGVVGSMKGIVRTDPEQVVNTLSYARHWRKYVALLIRFLDDPLLAPRLHLLGYEQLLTDPQQAAGGIAAFLGLSFDPRMTDARSFVDWGTGEQWSGNSSFGTERGTIDRSAAERWRETLDPGVRILVDWTCGPDMRVAGYDPLSDDPTVALHTLVAESREPSHWRSDDGDVVIDCGGEVLRRALLEDEAVDEELARRCYLFPEVAPRLRTPGRPLLGATEVTR